MLSLSLHPINEGKTMDFFSFLFLEGKSKFVEPGFSNLFSCEPNHTSTSTRQHWSLSLFTPYMRGKLWIFSFYFWRGKSKFVEPVCCCCLLPAVADAGFW